MTNQSKADRAPVTFILMDNDQDLPTELALVHKFNPVIIDTGEEQSAQNQLIADNDMKDIIAKHNEIRSKEINLTVLSKTGREIKLQPIKLKDLSWMAK